MIRKQGAQAVGTQADGHFPIRELRRNPAKAML